MKGIVISLALIAFFVAITFVVSTVRIASVEHVPMDADFIATLKHADPDKAFFVSSGGGDPAFGEAAARHIIAKEMTIKLGEICLSSCAEYVIPSAKTLIVSPRTLIGFHQNPLMIRHFADMEGYQGMPICYYEAEVDYLGTLHQRDGSDRLPWENVLNRLVLADTHFREKDECIETGFRFENQFWFPTSNQIKTLFQIDLNGPICADDPGCAEEMTNLIIPKGESVIIGDERYVSTGRER